MAGGADQVGRTRLLSRMLQSTRVVPIPGASTRDATAASRATAEPDTATTGLHQSPGRSVRSDEGAPASLTL